MEYQGGATAVLQILKTQVNTNFKVVWFFYLSVKISIFIEPIEFTIWGKLSQGMPILD